MGAGARDTQTHPRASRVACRRGMEIWHKLAQDPLGGCAYVSYDTSSVPENVKSLLLRGYLTYKKTHPPGTLP